MKKQFTFYGCCCFYQVNLTKMKHFSVFLLIILLGYTTKTETLTLLDSGWYQQNISGNYDLHDISFINNTTGWIISRTYNNNAHLLYTSNAGETWNDNYTFPSQTYFTIWFINNLTGIIAGSLGSIGRTTNGGLNWNIQNYGNGPILNELYFVNNSTGFFAHVVLIILD